MNDINRKESEDNLILKMNYKDCNIRPFAWRGSNLMGLSTSKSNVHVSIAVWDVEVTVVELLLTKPCDK